ncbi:InlB B-repeat-containing protein, partial [Paenibacillus sp. Soil766]|uniref:InlB B-repeat-containing protein n=1 Tax=Paenibacillus sp. Soil766 TaxID=1736404 RepID=UPI0039E1C5AB
MGFNNTVNTIVVSDTAVYAGGNFTATGSDSVSLVAKWSNSNPKISFNSNGGSVVSSQNVSYGGTAAEPIAPPTKEGYIFAGWYADSELLTAYDFTTAVTENMTLYAKWTSITITATPMITSTVHAGDTSVTGTAAVGAIIILSVNGTPTTPVTATGGNWTVSGLTLAPGDTISVTAQSIGETVSAVATTTAESVPVITNITGFDGIGDIAAGTAGAVIYADGATVSAALLASHANVAANGGALTVPVMAWVDTDNYNPAVAGSYTFTATLGSLPANTTNTGGLTATVEVVVEPVITNITGFDGIRDKAAGTADSASYADGAAVSAALLASHANVAANGGALTVPVTAWVDTDNYNPAVAGSYTFTATLGSLPANTTNTGGLTATVEVVVEPVITNITGFVALTNVSAGTAGAATYADGAAVS